MEELVLFFFKGGIAWCLGASTRDFAPSLKELSEEDMMALSMIYLDSSEGMLHTTQSPWQIPWSSFSC